MSFLAECAGVGVGIPVIKCASAATDYVFGWSVAAVFLLVVYFNLEQEDTADRVASAVLVSAVFVGLLTVLGLTPTIAYAWTSVLGVIVVMIQLFRKGR